MTTSSYEHPLQIIEVAANGATVVKLNGSVDSLNAEQLTRAFSDVPARHMVADCSEVSYTSSAGLRSLLATVKTCRGHGGDLRLAAMQPQVSRVLRITGFTSLIRVFDTVPTAVASFGTRPGPSPAD